MAILKSGEGTTPVKDPRKDERGDGVYYITPDLAKNRRDNDRGMEECSESVFREFLGVVDYDDPRRTSLRFPFEPGFLRHSADKRLRESIEPPSAGRAESPAGANSISSSNVPRISGLVDYRASLRRAWAISVAHSPLMLDSDRIQEESLGVVDGFVNLFVQFAPGLSIMWMQEPLLPQEGSHLSVWSAD